MLNVDPGPLRTPGGPPLSGWGPLPLTSPPGPQSRPPEEWFPRPRSVPRVSGYHRSYSPGPGPLAEQQPLKGPPGPCSRHGLQGDSYLKPQTRRPPPEVFIPNYS
ncbi:unnamed protein product [Arctogadus glacialis]